MKLESGKRYVMRNGEVTGVLRDVKRYLYPFQDEKRTWAKDGVFWSDGLLTEFDIISEYVEGGDQMKLEVGKRYRKRNGGVTVIVKEDGETFYDGVYSYWSNGRLSHSSENPQDIISEYVEPAPTEIDLTQIDKPFGELDRETKLALFAHWVDGGAIETMVVGGGWWGASTHPSWNPNSTYRAAPPPPQPLVVPWGVLDPGINWVAADENGLVHGFHIMPSQGQRLWINSFGYCTRLSGAIKIEQDPKLPWKDSLQARPGIKQE